MPQCQTLTTFHSARIADVYSAFIIFMIGVVTSLSLGLFERIWEQRRNVKERIVHGVMHRRELLRRERRERTIKDHSKMLSRRTSLSGAPIEFSESKSSFRTVPLGNTTSRPGKHRLNYDGTGNYVEQRQSLFNFHRTSGETMSTLRTKRHVVQATDFKDLERHKYRTFPFQN